LSPFLLAQENVTERRAPGENSLRQARSSIMKHPLPYSLSPRGRGAGVRGSFIAETRPSGSDSPKCLTLGLGHLAKFSHGNPARISDSNHYAKPRIPRSGRGVNSWRAPTQGRPGTGCDRKESPFRRSRKGRRGETRMSGSAEQERGDAGHGRRAAPAETGWAF
jgi:hypothetical protein